MGNNTVRTVSDHLSLTDCNVYNSITECMCISAQCTGRHWEIYQGKASPGAELRPNLVIPDECRQICETLDECVAYDTRGTECYFVSDDIARRPLVADNSSVHYRQEVECSADNDKCKISQGFLILYMRMSCFLLLLFFFCPVAESLNTDHML